MLGFGIAKLFFTLAVIAMIWYGSKWWARIRARAILQQQRRAAMDHEPAAAGSARSRRDAAVEDTVRCASCGAYVPARGPRSCGRADCPYPG
jgi:hypothetical protein